MTDKQLMIPDLEKSKALALVSQMDLLLEEADDWDAMLNVRNGALGIAAMAGAMRMEEVAQKAKIVQLKAERKAGDWLSRVPREPGVARDTRLQNTIEELGITPYRQRTWQQMARVPERLFHRWLDDTLKDGDEVSQRGFLRFIKPAGPKPEPEKPLSLLDQLTAAIKGVSEVLHAIGTISSPSQYRDRLSYARRAKTQIEEMLRAVNVLIGQLEKKETK